MKNWAIRSLAIEPSAPGAAPRAPVAPRCADAIHELLATNVALDKLGAHTGTTGSSSTQPTRLSAACMVIVRRVDSRTVSPGRQ